MTEISNQEKNIYSMTEVNLMSQSVQTSGTSRLSPYNVIRGTANIMEAGFQQHKVNRRQALWQVLIISSKSSWKIVKPP